MKNIIGSTNSLIRSLFSTELAFRFYVVFQLLGIVAIIYMDVSSSWDLFPTYFPADSYYNELRERGIRTFRDPDATWKITWDILHGSYWGGSSNKNWFAVLGLFGPFLIIKSIDWILAAKNKK